MNQSIISYPIQIRSQQLILTNERCIYWQDQNVVLLSDTHFGKSGHFRKEGIALPRGILENDLTRLKHIINHFQPKGIIVIGDLFHSTYNQEINVFKEFRNEFLGSEFHLISGNHDILKDEHYKELSIRHQGVRMNIGPFTFVHDIQDIPKESSSYHFCGHLHPGITIQGKGKQKLRFPCYYFSERYACLPAFSLFTGMSNIKPRKNDEVFMMTNDGVIRL